MNDAPANPFRLRDLGLGTRLGLSFLVLTLLGGLAASAQHLVWHHQKRDERPEMSIDDIFGAYHGIKTTAPLVSALQRGHPETLPSDQKALLLTWLAGSRISEDYDNLDLGAAAPSEVIASNCLSCHSRQSADAAAKAIPLEFFDDVKKLAFSRDVSPTDVKILAASTHTHAISLGMLSIVTAALLLGTRLPRAVVGLAITVIGAALFADLASWWLARETVAFAYLIVLAGTTYAATMSLAVLAVLADLWLPAVPKADGRDSVEVPGSRWMLWHQLAQSTVYGVVLSVVTLGALGIIFRTEETGELDQDYQFWLTLFWPTALGGWLLGPPAVASFRAIAAGARMRIGRVMRWCAIGWAVNTLMLASALLFVMYVAGAMSGVPGN
ncbi:MAG: hypothetical protein ACKVU4_09015 [Phycisphaerales bacterium]